MIVLSEASNQVPSSIRSQDIQVSTEIARLLGLQVYSLPPARSDQPAEKTFCSIPLQHQTTSGLWLGECPTCDRYQVVYQAALEKGIRLLNTPAEHQLVRELDQAYAKLQDLTPASVIVTEVSQCEAAIAQLGLPVFVREVQQSRKAEGWKACTAYTLPELRALTTALLQCNQPSSDQPRQKRVMIRQLVNLRYSRFTPQGFPQGREFRLIFHRGTLLTYGYRWEADDPLRYLLSVAEETEMLAIGLEAADRLQVPYVAIDVGQLADGSWTVIATDDPQAAVTHLIPLIQFWTAMRLL